MDKPEGRGSEIGRVLACALLAPALALGAAPPSSDAAARPRLLVLPISEGTALARESASLEAAAQEAVQRSGRFDLLPLTDALDAPSMRARRAVEEEAEGQLRAAQAFLDQLDTQASWVQANRAIASFERTDLVRTFPRLVKTWVIRIASEVANGESRAALKDLELLVGVDPSVELPPSYFPPDELARAAQLKREMRDGATGRLEVRSAPPGASVYVDGQFRGVSPMTVTGLTPVEHELTLRLPGYQVLQQRVRRGALSATLRPAEGLGRYRETLRQMSSAPTSRKLFELTQRLGQSLGADQVLVAQFRRDPNPFRLQVTLTRLDVTTGSSLGYQQRWLDIREPAGAQVERQLAVLLGWDDPEHRFAPEPPASTSGASSAVTGHVLLGVGAALVAGGITFGLLALGQQQKYAQIHTIGVAAAHPYLVRGKREALISDGLDAAGVICLGVGAYLTFFGPGPGTPARSASPERRPVPGDDLRGL